jgi:excinuclease UvrABC nuclease subunit
VCSHVKDDLEKIHNFVDSKMVYLEMLSTLMDRDSDINIITTMSNGKILASKSNTVLNTDPTLNVKLTEEQIAEYLQVFDALPNSLKGVERKNGKLFMILYQKQHDDVKDLMALIYPIQEKTIKCTEKLFDDYKAYQDWITCRIDLRSNWSLEHTKIHWKF